MKNITRRLFLERLAPMPLLVTALGAKSNNSNNNEHVIINPLDSNSSNSSSTLSSPAIITHSVKNLVRDGKAGLKRHFGAKGDGIHDDTNAFEDWWDCLIDISSGRINAVSDELPFMLQKGPVLEIESGVFIYSGKGLDFVNDSSLILNVTGQSSLSSKILINNDSYLFDLSRNPVYTNLSNLTVYGGKGAIRLQSKERTTTGIHLFSSLRVSRYSECAISNNSIDMPYFRVESCIFYGDVSKTTIGVCVSGYSAGGYISNCIFSDNVYGIKLAVSNDGGISNGPATPYNIVQNDFYRTGDLKKNSYDIWIEPGLTSNNSGRGIVFCRNKFGQEHLIKGDCHVLIADSSDGYGGNLNGDRLHSSNKSKGFVSGMRFDSNNVNSMHEGYSAPFIKTFTSNLGNNYFSDIYDNGMPEYIISFADELMPDAIDNLSRNNYFDASQCISLQKGSDPKMLSNKEGVFTVNDPLDYYCGHPQVSFKYGISMPINFLWLYKSPTNKLLLEDIKYSLTDNSYGGKNEAMVIHSITSKSRVYTIIKHSSPHTKHWIDFELKSININKNTIVVFELTSFDNKIIFLRRKILLSEHKSWQKVILPFIPLTSMPYKISLYAIPHADSSFILGNFNVYINEGPINTGHNGGGDMRWNMQHQVYGDIHEWYDSDGNKRAKCGIPEFDKDGVVISSNPLF
ncbi:TPA: hypothetical protein RFU01_003728 [Klebsiella variicola]|uniref:hypothetical protein n=1 Tax=Klebsiella variicola TaxID=244366 RepID=UPI001A917C1D|nr:hypothetical protein [Klebsiella variicola]HDU4823307.1 hypothetical protein [Klebsiella variicola]